MPTSPSDFGPAAQAVLERIQARTKAATNGTLAHRPDLQAPTICQRLEKKFGLGEQSSKRRALYRQLEQLHARFPDEVERIISEAVCQAAQADRPDRYFCVAVRRKIAAAGLTTADPSQAKW